MLKLEEIKEMCQMFGSLPDPDLYPKTFYYYIQLYQYLKQQRNQNDTTEE
jgi:hypothetical protein